MTETIKFYHWLGQANTYPLDRERIEVLHRSDCVVISISQQRYYIPPEYKLHKRQIINYIKNYLHNFAPQGSDWSADIKI